MRRLKKNWKVLAYLAGFAAATAVLPANVAAWYVVAGFAWLVVWLVRNDDRTVLAQRPPSYDLAWHRDIYGRLDNTEPLSIHYKSYFDRA